MNENQIVLTIKIISLICLAAVCVFFAGVFLKKKYSLYILPLCFFLGGDALTDHWIRKDYLFFCFFIPIFYFYSKQNVPMLVKVLIINVFSIPIILTHEVFAFFTFPILFLLLFGHYKNKGILQSGIFSLLCLLPVILAFLSTLKWHGNQEVAQNIWNSWTEMLHLENGEIGSAIDAIGWETKKTIGMHLTTNFLTIAKVGVIPIPSLLGWMITFPIIYYISVNSRSLRTAQFHT